MTKTTCLLVAWIWATAMFAQSKNWEVSGIIHSDLSVSVPGASIFVDDTLRGYTDELGFFKVKLKYRPKVLLVKRVGYTELSFKFKGVEFKERTKFLELTIQAADYILPEFTVTSKAIDHIFKEDFSSALVDYELIGEDQILLLGRKKKHYFLSLTSLEGSVIKNIDLPEDDSYTEIYPGCKGTYHIVGSKWTIETMSKTDQLDTLGQYPSTDFLGFVKPCIAFVNGCYFFEFRSKYSVQFDWMDPNGIYHPLMAVYDELAFEWMQKLVRDYYKKDRFEWRDQYEENAKKNRNAKPIESVDQTLADKPKDSNPLEGDELMDHMEQHFQQELHDIPSISIDSLYVPLFFLGDTVLFLNHQQSVMVRLEPTNEGGKLFKATQSPLTYHKGRGWRKFTVLDSYTGRAYGIFRKYIDGLTLRELDFETGAAGKSYVIREAPLLCQNYKARNGKLYFLGQPDPEIPNYNLYKVDLYQFGKK
jgi:hypothetical protein